MKKLIAMIGAVAMSFCAFADEPAAKLGISFETDEPGVGEGTFTPGEAGGKWSWPSGDPLELGAYATDELKDAGVYEASGDKERRTDEFPGGNDNGNYLKLDTGTAELIRTNDAPAGAGYVDQLVKFTGFEDPQTNLTAGIGVWMGEFVTNDTDDVELTETNLYVTVGKGAEQIALKIDKFGDNDFVAKIGQWYRLTIKPLGNIYKEGFEGDTRAGFAIYINGAKVSSSDSDAKALTEYEEQMTKAAKDAMDAGQLFTAVTAGPAAHTLAGFKGAGAIDDIILTADPPAFTIETVDVTFAPITGAIITKVVDSDGNEFDNPTGAISVKPGELTVTLAAAPGYRINSTGEYTVNTDDAKDGEITIEDAEDDVEAAVAYVVNAKTPATTNYTFEAELLTMVNGLVDGDTATFTAGATVTNGTAETLYEFTENTTITVAKNEDAITWDVAVNNVSTDLEGGLTDNVGVGAGNTMNVEFESEDGLMMLAADVAGALNVRVGQLEVTDDIEVAGTITAENLAIDYTITLSGSGKVIATDGTFAEDEYIVADEGDVEVLPDTPESDWYTYQIASTGFEVVIPAANTGTTLESIEVDGEAVQNPEAGTYEAEESVKVTYALVSGYRLASGSADLVQEFTGDGEATAPTAELIPTEDVVTITIGGQSTGYPSAQAALEAVWAAEQDESTEYPIVVKATAAGGLTINYNEQTAQIAQNDTITITPGSWEFSGALAYKGRIDGAVTATNVSIIAGGSITLGANGSVTVNDTTTLTTGSFSADSGYRVVEDTSVAGKKTFKTELIPVSATPGISFEAGEAGVDVDGTTFTPGAGWTWGADPFEIGTYVSETLPYGADGSSTARRHTLFLQERDNSNYLKLDTSAQELVRAMDAENGYVDQLIKFTGYEDIQTNFAANTKIAVWMGEICTNDDTEAMTTNLYVTVGKVADGSMKQVALKIADDYKLDTWYRLTVKPIGNIYVDGFTTDTRAGFAVYINGVQVCSDDDDAKNLTEFDSSLTAEASKLMEAGKLFTAIDGTSTSFDKVAYNGIGAIDDIILTDDKPAFIVDECTFTIAPPTGLYVVSVKNGATVLTPPYKVDPGTEVTITFGALPGWKITGNSTITRKINTDGQEITPKDDEIEFKEAVAYVVNAKTPATTNYTFEAELLTMVNGLVDGDTATFTAGATVTNGTAETLYEFTENTTITVANNEDAITWDVAVNNVSTDLEGGLTDNVGVGAGNTMNVEFESGDGIMMLGADVVGALNVTVGQLEVTDDIEVAGTITAENLTIDSTITLSGSGKVITTVGTLIENDSIVADVGTPEVLPDTPEEGWYTYQIAAAPGTFTVTVPDLTEGLAFVAMTNGNTEITTPAAGSYTVNDGDTFTVVYAPTTGYKFTEPDEDGVCEATKNDPTITPPTVEEILVTAITLDITSTNVVAGESFELIATVTPDTAKNKTIAWTTSDAGVATVADGMVTAGAAGTATITATNAASGKFATCTVTVSAPAPVIPWAGAGTPESPWELNNAQAFADLKDWTEDAEKAAQIAGKFFRVTGDDIALTAWEGIGTDSLPFSGILDGNGKTISVQFGTSKYNGLFGVASNAVIKDLTVNATGFSAIGDATGAAAVIGHANSVALTNVVATGVLGTSDARANHNLGGFIVEIRGESYLTACTNRMAMYGSYTKIGGFVSFGKDSTSSKTHVVDCSFEGTIDNSKSDLDACAGTGGFLGWDGAGNSFDFTNCRAIGEVRTAGAYCGMFVGYNNNHPSYTAPLIGRADTKPYGQATSNTFINWATVDNGDPQLASYLVPETEVADAVTYKVMVANSRGFTLTDAAASLTIVTNLAAYTGTVAVDDALTGYELNVSGDETKVVYTAALKTFDVTFNPNNGGDVIVSNNVAYGTAFADVAPKDLEKTGYTFAGWTPVVETIDGTVLEFTAQWTIQTFTVTVNLGEDITALATNKTQGGEAIAFTQTGDFTVNYGDSVAIKYACSVSGYEPTPSEASNGEVKDNWNVPTSTKHAIEYTITIALDGAAAPEGWTPGEGVATSNVTVETPAFTLPELTKTDFDFAGYVKEGETATNKVVTIENTTASASYTACFTAAQPVLPINPDEPLEPAGQANAATVAAEIAKGGTDVNTWVATVYGEGGKIPASKLNATTADNIALAVANDLPITANEPTFAVSASTVSADTNVAAFEFTLKDGEDDVAIKTITAKVKAMVRYTGDLATTFAQATDAQVDIKASPVEGKIKAELIKQTSVNAGFMKVEPQNPTVGGL